MSELIYDGIFEAVYIDGKEIKRGEKIKVEDEKNVDEFLKRGFKKNEIKSEKKEVK